MMDYHIHSNFSTDSKMSIEQIIINAKKRGINEIGITDHLDLDFPYQDIQLFFNRYLRKDVIEQCQSKHPDVNIVNGVEIGLTKRSMQETRDFFKNTDFDFLIASVHIVDNVDPFFAKFFENKTKFEAYTQYLKEILTCLDGFDQYSVIGHIGYASRFWNGKDKILHYDVYADILDEILKKVIAKGKGIEINTKGIDETGDTLPSKSIIARYKELGGEIVTIGSDAHKPERVGEYVFETQAYLKSIGFKYITHFKQQKPYYVKI